MLENLNTEFKREYTEDIKYAVLAFANTHGGNIYIGIEDDGKVCGVVNPDDTMLRLTNMVRDAIHPDLTIFTECRIEEIEGKDVIVLSIQRGTDRPYYLHSKGIRPSGVYVREGASSVQASETAIMRMIKETYDDRYETALSLDQNLTFEYTESVFRSQNIAFGEVQKKTLQIIENYGKYTNLGMLLSDQCVHTLKLAVFQGTDNYIFRDRAILEGSILKQAEEAINFLNRYNSLRSEFHGYKRIDQRAYPEKAVRETILNAITHRDYSKSASTLVSIYDDRIECVSYGSLMPGMQKDDIGSGISILRNKNLGDVLYKLKLIEQYGTGIPSIKNCYAETGLEAKFIVTSNTFKVILPNLNAAREIETRNPIHEENVFLYEKHPAYITDRQNAVMDLFKKKDSISRRDVDSLLGVTQTTSSLLLKEMAHQGLIIRVGNGPSSVYVQANRKH